MNYKTDDAFETLVMKCIDKKELIFCC